MAKLNLNEVNPETIQINDRTLNINYDKSNDEIMYFNITEEGTNFFTESDWSGDITLKLILEDIYHYGNDSDEERHGELKETIGKLLGLDEAIEVNETPLTCEAKAEKTLQQEQREYFHLLFGHNYDHLGEDFLEAISESVWKSRDESRSYLEILVDETSEYYETE